MALGGEASHPKGTGQNGPVWEVQPPLSPKGACLSLQGSKSTRASPVVRLVKNPAMQDTWGSIPGLGRSPGEGKGCPLQYSGLENSTDYIVHRVAESWTRLNDSLHFQSPTGSYYRGSWEINLYQEGDTR